MLTFLTVSTMVMVTTLAMVLVNAEPHAAPAAGAPRHSSPGDEVMAMAVMTSRVSTAVRVLGLTVALAAGVATPAAAQEGPLGVARDLYASARYDEALAMLNGVRQQESANPVNLRYIEKYRSLCLLALGRGAEAEAAIAVVVASDRCICRQRQRHHLASARRSPRSGSVSRPTSRAHVTRPRSPRSTGRTIRRPNNSSVICCGSSTIPTWVDGWPICACWWLGLSTSAVPRPRHRRNQARAAARRRPRPRARADRARPAARLRSSTTKA